MKKVKVFYRIITPSQYSNKDYGSLKAAEEGLIRFGTTTSEVEEYIEYWKEQANLCKIVKVTEVIEEEL